MAKAKKKEVVKDVFSPGTKYIFKEGYLTCFIIKSTKYKVKFRINLSNFDIECTKKEFLKVFKEYTDE